MTPAQWEQVKRLFHEALDRPAHGRVEWLAEQGAGDDVCAEVERLLAAHVAAGSFIEKPAIDWHSPPDPPRGARIGTWLGKYRLDSLLGAGGMGEVYHAFDSDLGRSVAIKVVGRDEPAAHDRLRREACHASHLNHPNVCTIHHVGDDEGRPYVVMEFVEGRPLSELIARPGLSAATAVNYAVQILDALGHAHDHGVIHRDLKSANVIVRPNGHLKLLDFGLARQIDRLSIAPLPVSTAVGQLTAAGGTLPYIAPEILRGQPADARGDLWAFGVLLHEMVTGALPFAGETAYEIGSAILSDAPPQLPASVPAPLASCIARCLAKDREDRPRDAAEVRAQLVAGTSSRSMRRLAAAAAIGLVSLAAVASATWPWRRADGPPAAAAIRSLAVLPFENLSGDPAQEYFADGVTESLIRELGNVGRLRVTPRTTAMRYRGTRKASSDVATELKVDAIMHGSVLREGDRVRIAATLLRGGSERLWTDTFDRPAREILALQRDIVRTAATRIALALTPQEDARLGRVRSVDPDVYEAYLKGRFYWNKRTQESLATAVEHFRAAIASDPTYAPAHVGLADCYNQLGTALVGSGSPARMRPQALAAAIAALQIDPMLAEAHAALAYARHYDWQWDAAGRSFQRALELDENNALVHLWYANYLASLRRLDEAVAHVERARELDPLSLVVQTNVGWTLSFAGRFDEAIAAYREALALDPDYIQANSRLASAYAETGQFDPAFASAEGVVRLTRRNPPSVIALANLNAVAGRRREAERLMRELVARARTEYVSPFALSQLYIRLGDVDRGFEGLERAYEERSNGMVYLAVEQVYVPVHSDPRFQDLLKRVGLVRKP